MHTLRSCLSAAGRGVSSRGNRRGRPRSRTSGWNPQSRSAWRRWWATGRCGECWPPSPSLSSPSSAADKRERGQDDRPSVCRRSDAALQPFVLVSSSFFLFWGKLIVSHCLVDNRFYNLHVNIFWQQKKQKKKTRDWKRQWYLHQVSVGTAVAGQLKDLLPEQKSVFLCNQWPVIKNTNYNKNMKYHLQQLPLCFACLLCLFGIYYYFFVICQ